MWWTFFTTVLVVLVLAPALFGFIASAYYLYKYCLSSKDEPVQAKWMGMVLGVFANLFFGCSNGVSKRYFNRAAFAWLFFMCYVLLLYLIGAMFLGNGASQT